MTENRVACKHCGRPATPSRVKNRDRRCKRCINASPAGVARIARYNASAARKAVQRKFNARRLYVGGEYHSTARTAAEARRINAHIKRMAADFESSQRAAMRGGGPGV